MQLITTSELRNQEYTFNEIIEFLNKCATDAKNDKRTSYRTYGPDGIFGKKVFYGLKEKDYPEIVKKTLTVLREAGFDARIAVDSISFDNIFLYVEW